MTDEDELGCCIRCGGIYPIVTSPLGEMSLPHECVFVRLVVAAHDQAKFDHEQAVKLGLDECACSLCAAVRAFDAQQELRGIIGNL